MKLSDLARKAKAKQRRRAERLVNPAEGCTALIRSETPASRGALKELSEEHQLFVTAWISQRMTNAGAALRKVSPGATDEEAQWLLEQPLIEAEIRRQLIPLFRDQEFAAAWVSSQLFQIAQANILDYLVPEECHELLRDESGAPITDEKGKPKTVLRSRMVLRQPLDQLSIAKQMNIKKITIRRHRDGDIIEIELHDRHKAIVDIATLAGIRDLNSNRDAMGRVFAEEMSKAAQRQERLAAERREALQSGKQP